MLKQTPLHPLHREAQAKLVPFSGWEMPLHYGSQVEEHHAVRRGAGLFDVSHMARMDLAGPAARPLLRQLLACDVARIATPGGARYGVMLNDAGGVEDDLLVAWMGGDRFRLVTNAGTRERMIPRVERAAAESGVAFRCRDDLAMLALQGPAAADHLAAVLHPEAGARVAALAHFTGCDVGTWSISRTGYTGEDGFEIMLPVAEALDLWRTLLARGVQPCGLGARDTLRLEAGLNLYGSDMDQTVNPLVCGLGWTIDWEPEERAFSGRSALAALRDAGVAEKRVGLLLETRGVLRDHQPLFRGGQPVGHITSGSYSPTLERGIALARVAVDVALGEALEVEVRGRRLPVRVVKPAFVRNGKALLKL